jgi:hypothetical protein
VTLFEIEALGGPWARRLAPKRAGWDDLPWAEAGAGAAPDAVEHARWVWTQSAFSEYASAAAFAEIASLMLAAGAPIDLVAAAGEFVCDEVLHAELSARVAMALGGAVPLEVDRTRLVRPPSGQTPLLRAAELVGRTSCVGEALTVPILKSARAACGSPLVERVIARILADESVHAQLGGWFLDWADDRLSDGDRAHLGEIASAAVRDFAPILGGGCGTAGLGVLDCARYDAAFAAAVAERVIRPLRARGIVVRVAPLD